MSKVRGGDTKPEWILRCGLHRLGFRYGLRNKRLPGRPDLVFRKYKAIVFVHGCFWHAHPDPDCKLSRLPKSNRAFWREKLNRNTERDARNTKQLKDKGWRVLTVWECELTGETLATIERVAKWLRGGKRITYPKPTLDRSKLLKVAEAKVRYRIDKYSEPAE